MITAVYTLFQEGNVLSWIRVAVANGLDKINQRASKYIQKPLWDCLPCMASVWGMLFSWSINVELLLIICGLNVLIDRYATTEG